MWAIVELTDLVLTVTEITTFDEMSREELASSHDSPRCEGY